MIVAVGSKNPTKIKPVKKVFSNYFKNLEVIAIEVESGVSEQPKHEDEMFKGALNRAKNALKKIPKAKYGVGIEGGIHKHSFGWQERSLVVVVDKKGNFGVGSAPALSLPEEVTKLIEEGKRLDQAVELVSGAKNIRKGIGVYGVFTKGFVTRAKGMEHAIAFALSRFLHNDLF